jgi:segregation and condensation protein A
MADYRVKLKVFEGPMDLLMHLIEKNKIDIYDIPIAVLTQQYLDYLSTMRELDLEIASSFLVMAATLLDIKSRMMLPKKPQKAEEEEEDPRQELVEKLLEYRKYQKVSEVLKDQAILQERYVSREPMVLPVHHVLGGSLSMSALLKAFSAVLKEHQELSIPDAIIAPDPVSIEDCMDRLSEQLHKKHGSMVFSEAFVQAGREELITTFLALLEMIKRKLVRVKQKSVFDEIYITATGESDGR